MTGALWSRRRTGGSSNPDHWRFQPAPRLLNRLPKSRRRGLAAVAGVLVSVPGEEPAAGAADAPVWGSLGEAASSERTSVRVRQSEQGLVVAARGEDSVPIVATRAGCRALRGLAGWGCQLGCGGIRRAAPRLRPGPGGRQRRPWSVELIERTGRIRQRVGSPPGSIADPARDSHPAPRRRDRRDRHCGSRGASTDGRRLGMNSSAAGLVPILSA